MTTAREAAEKMLLAAAKKAHDIISNEGMDVMARVIAATIRALPLPDDPEVSDLEVLRTKRDAMEASARSFRHFYEESEAVCVKLRAELAEAKLWDERSRAANMETVRALGDWLLVPPDGGSQTLAEGVEALKADLAAARAQCNALTEELEALHDSNQVWKEQAYHWEKRASQQMTELASARALLVKAGEAMEGAFDSTKGREADDLCHAALAEIRRATQEPRHD